MTTQQSGIDHDKKNITAASHITFEYISKFLNNKLNTVKEKPFINIIGEYEIVVPSKAIEPNISQYVSVLYCLSPEFRKYDEITKINCINELKKYIKTIDSTMYDIKKPKLDNKQYISLACLFEINVFILNLDNNQIYVHYPEKCFNKYKNNVLLSFNNGVHKPVSLLNKFVSTYTDTQFAKLLISKNLDTDIFDLNSLYNSLNACETRVIVACLSNKNSSILIDNDETDEGTISDDKQTISEMVDNEIHVKISDIVVDHNDITDTDGAIAIGPPPTTPIQTAVIQPPPVKLTVDPLIKIFEKYVVKTIYSQNKLKKMRKPELIALVSADSAEMKQLDLATKDTIIANILAKK
ncbi:MAG: hypothetical protein Faunusvirus3_34 [Faunusvirus sp.]|jgi:hypothetical protein|uniref:Uncharacterized protein n=1 Tax=Faunusvirus sp. TaxID=2487766 RepID=A0A3G4ZXT2_9VIRU|nr:MAG: hypothetical protein Faunusvirus3_34 [Faunusvirus sp.]